MEKIGKCINQGVPKTSSHSKFNTSKSTWDPEAPISVFFSSSPCDIILCL